MVDWGTASTVTFRMPGNDLKFYDGFWHIRINDQWRLAWQWTGDGPEKVKIYDPH